MVTKRLKHDLSGQTLGFRYKLEEAIGTGGFASVYRATDVRIRKSVAIKVLHPEHTRNITDVERFRNEAAIAGRIDDDHFVKVSDFFQDGEHFCFVMEYLQGWTLREEIQRLQGKPMSWPRAFKLAREICAGLDVAHSHNVIHRDIKPENIFVARPRSGPERVKLLDLGVAKIMQDHYWSGLRKNLSNTGDIIGSPCYIAPEIVQGVKTCDPRVDIYSLGIVIYEMVTGVVPFRGNNAYETMYHHVHTEPTRPTALIKGLIMPRPLEDIILSAISKEAEMRFRTIREMDAAIRHELDHQGSDPRRSRPAQIMPAYDDGQAARRPQAGAGVGGREHVLEERPADVAGVESAHKESAVTSKRPHDQDSVTTAKVAQKVQVASGSADTDSQSSMAVPVPREDQSGHNDFTPSIGGVDERPEGQTSITSLDMHAIRGEEARRAPEPHPNWQELHVPLRGTTWLLLAFLVATSLFATLAVGFLLMKTIDTEDIDRRARNRVAPVFLGENSPVSSQAPAVSSPEFEVPAPGVVTPSPEPVGAALPAPLPSDITATVENGAANSASTAENGARRTGKNPVATVAKPRLSPAAKEAPPATMASIAARAEASIEQDCKIHHMAGAPSADYAVVFKVDPAGGVMQYIPGPNAPLLANDSCVIAKVRNVVKDFVGASDLREKFEHKYKVVR